jgi:hypothetical protein
VSAPASESPHGPLFTPLPWLVTVMEAQSAMRRDDDMGAVLARREMDAVLDAAPCANDPQACPDNALWAVFHATARAWALRSDPVARSRISGPLISALDALIRMPGERRRAAEAAARLSPLERGLPPKDR